MRPRLRNRNGDPVDPWPFVVVAATGSLPVLSVGPIYLTALGVPLRPAVGCSVAVSAAVVAVAYRQFVLTCRPGVRSEVPAAARVRRLLWLTLVLVALCLLLSLPFLGRSL